MHDNHGVKGALEALGITTPTNLPDTPAARWALLIEHAAHRLGRELVDDTTVWDQVNPQALPLAFDHHQTALTLLAWAASHLDAVKEPGPDTVLVSVDTLDPARAGHDTYTITALQAVRAAKTVLTVRQQGAGGGMNPGLEARQAYELFTAAEACIEEAGWHMTQIGHHHEVEATARTRATAPA